MQIKKKFLLNGSVDNNKILLLNNGALKARNAADSADVSLMKLDASNVLMLLKRPQIDSEAAAASADADVITKKYADDLVKSAVTDKLGAVNGIATLDANGKLPSSQLTVDAFEYKGTWSASANSPALEDGTGNKGDIYQVTSAGAVDFGAGSISFAVGDKVVYSGSVWEKWDMSDSVDSVNGQTGAVSLDAGDIAYTQGDASKWTVADNSKIDATLDEVGSRLVALEGASVEFAQEKITLDSDDIEAGYIDLAVTAIAASINAFVDRLAIHETDDYTVSVVSGKTRLTFAGALAAGGLEAVASGDVITVKYAKKPL